MIACGLTAVAAAAFYVPGRAACGGAFPVPLDDAFIHFDFARSLCRGSPFAWIAGQGFSSGETAPLYAVVLAFGWAIGFRGAALAPFAAIVACVSIASAMVSLRSLIRGAPWVVACGAAALVVSIGALDFAFFSGMEVALFAALAVRAFVLAERMMRAPPHLRARAQWRLGMLGALLVWVRPEAAVVVAVLSVLAARHARSQSPLGALARVALPGALATASIAALNWTMTGDFASAGARLKLLSSNPYLSDLDRARELVLNIVNFWWRVIEASAVFDPRLVWVLGACALAPLLSARTRDLGAALLASAVLFAVLVSFNGAARFQGFRYYAPALVMLVCAVALGLSVIARRFGAAVSLVVVVVLAGGAAARAETSIRFFRDASANIHDQQMRVGEKLRTLGPPGARVLINDAGAIPWVADRGAVDALGLGGYRLLPFTRAALSGEASMLELVQRMAPADRPALIAVYPNWFPAVTQYFAREIDHVTIEHNVICGGPTKIIALADWTPLDSDTPPANVIDDIDIADIESEAAHAYASPAPRGGWATANVIAHVFDGGRIIPAGETESFDAHASGTLVMRSDEAIDATVQDMDLVADHITGAWTIATCSVERGRVVVRARKPLRDFHLWIVAR